MTSSTKAASTTATSTTTSSTVSFVLNGLVTVVLLQLLYRILLEAYDIRLYAIKEFGRIIHEFDPYFNYRATEYLYEHGWYKFRTWFDYMVWYPLGRPVGTTIYPGMQVTAVYIKKYVLTSWSINDICVFIPAWFGATATLSVGWLTFNCTYNDGTINTILNDVPIARQINQYVLKPIYNFVLTDVLFRYCGTTFGFRPTTTTVDTTGSSSSSASNKENNWLVALSCGVAAAAIMSVVPAHLLRSIGGGYDNESIAMTAMVMTYATWTYTLRSRSNEYITILWGIITGLAYFYMVAAWGGYVFVLNIVGVHACSLILLGRYSRQLHRAYTSFFLVGTFCATFVPVVGYTPLKSLEQMGPLLAFGGFQLIELCEVLIEKRRKGVRTNYKAFSMKDAWILRSTVFGVAALALAMMAYGLLSIGYFGPISSRVRGLFVKHTKTGNPLVDSVAEHQAASPEAYKQYLHDVVLLVPYGLLVTMFVYWNDASSFLLIYSFAAYYFSHRMVRLILLTAPIASVLGGIVIGRITAWAIGGMMELAEVLTNLVLNKNNTTSSASTTTTNSDEAAAALLAEDTSTTATSKGKGGGKKSASSKTKDNNDTTTTNTKNGKNSTNNNTKSTSTKANPIITIVLLLLRMGSVYYIGKQYGYKRAVQFHKTGHEMAKAISHPTIVQKARKHSGEEVLVDDYREAYNWLKFHTPEDARIMAWWDYGYQITGIGNRTTLADGNTWNHEHIALLGRILTAPEKDAHRIARHLADYVLVWAGGGGDDVAKSPHLRRIANSVYRGLCREPTCNDFGFYSDRTPTDSMSKSLLYTLHSHRLIEGVQADPNRFREVFNSKYGRVRIYKIQSVAQESKAWVADAKNRVCDAPGSWFCPGQYPPALEKILSSKKDFQQLEDFNKKDGSDDEYTKQYFENLDKKNAYAGDNKKPRKAKKNSNEPKEPPKKLSIEEIEMINEHWENNEYTSKMYELISANQVEQLAAVLKMNPHVAHIRSEDGRGPMWWAHEMGHKQIVELLRKQKVSEKRTDQNGKTPLSITTVK